MQREGGNAQTDTYILKGDGPETYEPKYGWKGYRYVQVSVAPGTAVAHRPVGHRRHRAHGAAHVR